MEMIYSRSTMQTYGRLNSARETKNIVGISCICEKSGSLKLVLKDKV